MSDIRASSRPPWSRQLVDRTLNLPQRGRIVPVARFALAAMVGLLRARRYSNIANLRRPSGVAGSSMGMEAVPSVELGADAEEPDTEKGL
jgi:hypothetical protein